MGSAAKAGDNSPEQKKENRKGRRIKIGPPKPCRGEKVREAGSAPGGEGESPRRRSSKTGKRVSGKRVAGRGSVEMGKGAGGRICTDGGDRVKILNH